MSYDIQQSDSENYDQLMNKGWLSMSEILEVELPQKSRELMSPIYQMLRDCFSYTS